MNSSKKRVEYNTWTKNSHTYEVFLMFNKNWTSIEK